MATPTTTQAAPAAALSTPATTSVPVTAPPAAATNTDKTFKIKVDGVEQAVSEAELIVLAQKGKSADKRFNEGAQAKREAQQIVEYLKSNPKEAFQKLGIDVRKFSEDTLMELIQAEKMNPEQRKAAENEKKLREYEAREKAVKDKETKEAHDKLVKEAYDGYEASFMEALSLSGLPKTSFTLKRMVELEVLNTKKGFKLAPAQLAKMVREDYENEHRNLYSQVDGDTLLAMLGKEGVKKLSKAQLAKLKTSPQPARPAQATSTAPASSVDTWKQQKAETRKKLRGF